MLDKTIPYHRVIMTRKAGTSIPSSILPEGFSFRLFQLGDEQAWAAIEAAVGEFEQVEDALLYFRQQFMPFHAELERRTLFVVNPDQELIATLTIWWRYIGERRHPWIHWVAVMPEYQGLGIGKALVCEGLRRLLQIEGDPDVYLSTQTWSYKAIGIYLYAGFSFNTVLDYGQFHNEYEQAINVLKQVMPPACFAQIRTEEPAHEYRQ